MKKLILVFAFLTVGCANPDAEKYTVTGNSTSSVQVTEESSLEGIEVVHIPFAPVPTPELLKEAFESACSRGDRKAIEQMFFWTDKTDERDRARTFTMIPSVPDNVTVENCRAPARPSYWADIPGNPPFLDFAIEPKFSFRVYSKTAVKFFPVGVHEGNYYFCGSTFGD